MVQLLCASKVPVRSTLFEMSCITNVSTSVVSQEGGAKKSMQTKTFDFNQGKVQVIYHFCGAGEEPNRTKNWRSKFCSDCLTPYSCDALKTDPE